MRDHLFGAGMPYQVSSADAHLLSNVHADVVRVEMPEAGSVPQAEMRIALRKAIVCGQRSVSVQV